MGAAIWLCWYVNAVLECYENSDCLALQEEEEQEVQAEEVAAPAVTEETLLISSADMTQLMRV